MVCRTPRALKAAIVSLFQEKMWIGFAVGFCWGVAEQNTAFVKALQELEILPSFVMHLSPANI
jgi:hypothetical protein